MATSFSIRLISILRGCVKKGGRRSYLDSMPELRDNFQEILRHHTAGDPMREDVKWTNLTKTEIANRLAQTSTPVSVNIVTQLLDDADFHRRKLRKTLAMGTAPRRNDQFERIAQLVDLYENTSNPVLSMDTKKKEPLGPYYRPGLLTVLRSQPRISLI